MWWTEQTGRVTTDDQGWNSTPMEVPVLQPRSTRQEVSISTPTVLSQGGVELNRAWIQDQRRLNRVSVSYAIIVGTHIQYILETYINSSEIEGKP